MELPITGRKKHWKNLITRFSTQRWSWIHNKPQFFQLFKSIVRVWPKVWPQLILHLKLSVELRCPLLCRAFLTFFEKHLRIKEGQDEGSSWKRFSVQCCTKKLRKLLKKIQNKKNIKIQNEKIYVLDSCIILYAVAIWPVTCQGFPNTKWLAVLYSQ